jgi:hypothetical protein
VGAEWSGNDRHDAAAGWPEEEGEMDMLCAASSQYAVCQTFSRLQCRGNRNQIRVDRSLPANT